MCITHTPTHTPFTHRFIIWRLPNPESAELMSQGQSKGRQAAVEPGRVKVPVPRLSGRRISPTQGRSAFLFDSGLQ